MAASDRRKQATEEAAAWWVRLQTEELPRAEREQFVDWLRESAVHVAEMLHVAKVHGALEHFQRWAHISTDGPDQSNVVSLHGEAAVSGHGEAAASGHEEAAASGSPPPACSPFRRRLRLCALAASFAGLVIAATWPLISVRGQTIQTERGERREVALSDGSVVAVDPETRLRVNFEEHTRGVFLDRGRALFRVAKNPDRPFLVHADGTTVRAVGTAFGVERQKQGIVVTVAEGKVAVFQMDSAQPLLGVRLLTAGEQVTMQSSGTAEPVRKVDSDRKLAWAKGRLDFDNQTVATAVQEFNRYNRVQLHVADEALAKRPVSGVFDASDPESFIAFIQTMAPVRVARSNRAAPGNTEEITLAMAVTSADKPAPKELHAHEGPD